jgi:sulfhydrogenase subunit alpha
MGLLRRAETVRYDGYTRMADSSGFTIDELSKIEGKAHLSVTIGDTVDVRFGITEFKRFYTQALTGKDAAAIPQLTARICGTCSNAHLMCAVKAIEKAFGMTPTAQTMVLRELLNWGLYIRDHALHLYVFALPDILGIDSILDVDMGNAEHRQLLEDTFAIKAAGNTLAKVVGGRSVHAPFVGVGGFLKLPDPAELGKAADDLRAIRPRVLRCIGIFLNRDNRLDRDVSFAAMVDDRLSMLGGKILDSEGTVADEETFLSRLTRRVIPYSNAVGYLYNGSVHMVGAIARLNLGRDRIHENTRRDAAEALTQFPTKNIFRNNLAQAIEILHAVDSAIETLSALTLADEKPIPITRREAAAVGVIEAPRGTLLYRFAFDAAGKATDVAIIVPTGQNQIGIEDSIRQYVTANRQQPKAELVTMSERIIRAYDPCMSCASHFLKVKWTDRRHR